MKADILAIAFVLIALTAVSICDNLNQDTTNDLQSDPRFDQYTSELLAHNVLQLAQDIGTTVLQDSDKASEVFSPLSIYTALSMLLMGANGQTYQELLNLLKFNSDTYLSRNSWKIHEEFGLMIEDINRDFPDPRHKRPQAYWQTHRMSSHGRPLGRTPIPSDPRSFQRITVANGIFVQNGFSIRNDYKDAMESIYKSTLQKLDFINNADLSTKYINTWVDEKTEGKIKELFTAPLSSYTKVVIASALFFKAMWKRRSWKAQLNQNFYPDGLDGPPITVDMMAHGGLFPFYESKEYDCRIIGLPYRRNLTTMFVIMPNNSNRTRLRQLQATLTADRIEDMISRMEWKTAIILFPKLHIVNEMNLKTVLNRMGLRSLFQNGVSDLSLISTGVEYVPNAIVDTKAPTAINLESSNRQHYNYHRYPGAVDDNNDEPFLFSRFHENDMINRTANTTSERSRRSTITYKTSSDFHREREPLRLKDFVLGKRITKSFPRKKNVSRHRRQASLAEQSDPSASVKRLDLLRNHQRNMNNPGLLADEIIHRVDLTVNEVGTEGGAATATSLFRTGTDVLFRTETPFLFLIRHDDTKLPLFYGTVFEPTNDIH